ncbi:histone deacetylase [Pedobacter sp. BS3]|uniref:histone deacetylase family protein n=1 Tax=Pedobacter sp. BS3 TaxID=2567937 RepID=UPI0011ED5BB9|nr:histone deacetylase [Pedobacter sp. BS3]TZF83638.1 histone deacetylase [Pedobacter sp. BS3]
MLKIAYHPLYVHPLPAGHRFPMLKYELIPEQLLYEGIVSRNHFFEPQPVDEEIILLTHEMDYWRRLRDLQLTADEERRTGFKLSPRLVERERLIAGGTVEGAVYALNEGIAFNVAGGTHHAGSNWGEGFCLLNDQAIAANYLLSQNLATSVLIIDLDVHQGNGTAEIFQQNPQVFTFSMHAEHNFPFRKEKSDWDIGLPAVIGDEEYLQILQNTLSTLFQDVKPDFVFYLSGVDVLATDKLGKLALSTDGCKQRDKLVLEYCKRYDVPVQVSMGGGYSPDIRDIVNAHCNTFKIGEELWG